MRVTLFTNSFKRPSLRFVRRHIAMLSADNALHQIIVMEPHPTTWAGVPVRQLRYQPPLLTRLQDGLRRHVLRQNVAVPSAPEMLGLLLRDAPADVDSVLIEFANVAVDFAPQLIASGKRLFVHVHGYDTQIHMHSGAAYGAALRDLSEHVQYICTSREIASRLTALGITQDRLIMKPYGVDVPAYHLRQASQHVTILHLGRLIAVKGPLLTIRAFELACEQGLDGRLVMAGAGDMLEACRAHVAQSKWQQRITFTGAVTAEEADTLYQQADIFTLHSVRVEATQQVEAFGVVIVEAMAASLPVVGTRSGGPAELIQHGQTGFLGDPHDIQQQANAFLQLANDPELRRNMGRAGWERAKAHYSYEEEARQLRRILNI